MPSGILRRNAGIYDNAVRGEVCHACDDGVGDPYLAAGASLHSSEVLKNCRVQCVTSDDRQVAGGFFAWRFFDHLFDGDNVWLDGWSGDDPFGVDVVPRGFSDRDDVPAVAIPDV